MPSALPHRKATLRRIGNSVGLTLPKDVLERSGLAEKSTVFLVETPDGILIKRYDESFATAMEVYRKGAAEYRDALRELSK